MVFGEKIKEMDLEVQFAPHEVIPLLSESVGKDFTDYFRNKDSRAYKHIARWLHPEVEDFGQDIGEGAGGVRSVGRLCFFSKFDEIEDRFDHNINFVTQGVINATQNDLPNAQLTNQVQVYVIFSLAGGTGSGTFLDVAFLLRKLLQDGAPIEKIIGVVALPNVYYESVLGERAARSWANAYAGLKELEFYCRRKVPSKTGGDESKITIDFQEEWKEGYPDRPVVGPPFGSLYIFEMQNDKNIKATDRADLFQAVADWQFMNFLPGNFSAYKRGRLADMAHLKVRSQENDVYIESAILPQQFSRRYSSFGIAKLQIPSESIREACACRLVEEILKYWNRMADEVDFKGTLERQTRKKFDPEGMEDLYGLEWRKKIESQISAALPDELPSADGDPSPLLQFIETLPAKLRALEDNLFSSVGKDPLRWGTITQETRNTTPRVVDSLRQKLDGWLAECLQRPELGINALLHESGLLRLLIDALRNYHAAGGCTQRQKAAQEQAEEQRTWRDQSIADLNYATRSWGVRLLSERTWSGKELYGRVRVSAQKQAMFQAAALLAEESGKLAQQAENFLNDRQSQLKQFRDKLDAIATGVGRLKDDFLHGGKTGLNISVFDPQKDFDQFYVSWNPGTNEHVPITLSSVVEEQSKFLDRKVGANKTLLNLINQFQQEGEEELRQSLIAYATQQFRDDFAICEGHRGKISSCPRALDVLKHPSFTNRSKQLTEQFVNSAIPLLRRGGLVGGTKHSGEKLVCLYIADENGADYKTFINDVAKLLDPLGYPKPFLDPTGDPSQVQLVIETHVFPLPTIQFVTSQAHRAYYDFYSSLRNRALGENSYKIPLHLCKNWEGEFDDLLPLDQEAGKTLRAALEVLCLGPVLGVIKIMKDGNREYAYREYRPPSIVSRNLGNRREAIEYLKANNEIRQQFLQHIHARHSGLQSTAALQDGSALAYCWALSYLNEALFTRIGSAENSIVYKFILEQLEFPKRAAGRGRNLP